MSGDFDSRKRLSRVRISRGSMNIVYFLSVGSEDFKSKYGLSIVRRYGLYKVRIFKGSTYIVFFLLVGPKISTPEMGSLERESLEEAQTLFFFFSLSAGSTNFDSREWLSRVRISRGGTNIVYFLWIGFEDFDSKYRLSKVRIS